MVILTEQDHPPRAERVRFVRPMNFVLTVPALLLLVVFFILPVLSLLLRSVMEPTPGLENYAALLGSTTYLKIFLNTFVVSSLVTAVTLASSTRH